MKTPQSLMSAMNATQPKTSLFDMIYSFPTKIEQIDSLKQLSLLVQKVKWELKRLREENPKQIQITCKQNSKLVFIAKMLKQEFFNVNNIRLLPLDSTQTHDNQHRISENTLPSGKNLPKIQLSIPEPVLVYKQSCHLGPQSNGNVKNIDNESIYSNYRDANQERQLKLCIMSMFDLMLTSQKMLDFLTKINVKFYMYCILVQLLSKLPIASCLRRKQAEKGIMFIYKCIKISSKGIPMIFAHLVCRLLNNYRQYETQCQKHESVKLFFNYVFESAILVVKKNLELASRSGILAVLYSEAIEGKFPAAKRYTIIELLISLCAEEKSRNIIHHTIDLGRVFAVFINVDFAEYKAQVMGSNSSDNSAKIKACSQIILKLLSEWPTLSYFINQKRTLNNFIATLKRKQQCELDIINQSIFQKIIYRVANYNKAKIKRSKNHFINGSDFLNLRSLVLLAYLFEDRTFLDTMHLHDKHGRILPALDKIIIAYFTDLSSFQKHQIDPMVIINIKNLQSPDQSASPLQRINYLKPLTRQSRSPFEQQRQKIQENIKSFCNNSLIPYEFSNEEIRDHLLDLLASQKDCRQSRTSFFVTSIYKLLDQLKVSKKQQPNILKQFYKTALQASKLIPWQADSLQLSKFLSNIVRHLRNQNDEEIREIVYGCLEEIFTEELDVYFQYLFVNIINDIGRFFYNQNRYIEFVKRFVGQSAYAYKISRILLHVDYERSLFERIDGPNRLHSLICKQGSIQLVLQIIEIIKLTSYQNEYRFQQQHVAIIFNNLIYHDNEDIVYSVTELLEEVAHKNQSIVKDIMMIDLKRIQHNNWQKRLIYLMLGYEEGIKKIQAIMPKFLRDQLQEWTKNGDNQKKNYYAFMIKEMRKYIGCLERSADSEHYNLGMEPSDYRKLIFLPWNVRINQNIYPAFVEYKSFQEKLKLKIFLQQEIKKQVFIADIFIGAHSVSLEIEPSLKRKIEQKYKITVEEIQKYYVVERQKTTKQINKLTMTKDNLILFIRVVNDTFFLDQIIINLFLSGDIYHPLIHPLNLLDLLGMTKYGMDFLRKEKFMQHCMDLVREADKSQPASKDDIKQRWGICRGAMMCIGTVCCSKHVSLNEKLEILELMHKRMYACANFEIQEIAIWVLNILVKDEIIRKRLKEDPTFIVLSTKQCEDICFPNFQIVRPQQLVPKRSHELTLRFVKANLPDKLADEVYVYIYNFLNEDIQEKNSHFNEEYVNKLFESITAKVFETSLAYMSVIHFPPAKINAVLERFGKYIASERFESDFSMGINFM